MTKENAREAEALRYNIANHLDDIGKKLQQCKDIEMLARLEKELGRLKQSLVAETVSESAPANAREADAQDRAASGSAVEALSAIAEKRKILEGAWQNCFRGIGLDDGRSLRDQIFTARDSFQGILSGQGLKASWSGGYEYCTIGPLPNGLFLVFAIPPAIGSTLNPIYGKLFQFDMSQQDQSKMVTLKAAVVPSADLSALFEVHVTEKGTVG